MRVQNARDVDTLNSSTLGFYSQPLHVTSFLMQDFEHMNEWITNRQSVGNETSGNLLKCSQVPPWFYALGPVPAIVVCHRDSRRGRIVGENLRYQLNHLLLTSHKKDVGY